MQKQIIEEGLEIYLADTSGTWELRADGGYRRVEPERGDAPFSAQEWLIEKYSG
jgi:polyphosphate kinase